MRITPIGAPGGGMIFGHQSSGQNSAVPQNQNDQVAPTNIDGVQQDSNAPTPDPLRIDPTSDMQAPSLDELEDNQPPTTVLNQPQSEPTTSPDVEPEAAAEPEDPTPAPALLDSPAPSKDDLLELKKQALGELSPLVDHLDQTPEEKFRTTMMLIQSTDNADLLKEAHTAAQAISDEKVRAQALLDIVNEINYFTHKSDHPES